MLQLVLASASPRRRELLSEAGYEFVVDAADVDEEAGTAGMAPGALAEHLARLKASVVARRRPDAVVLGADTVVALGDRALGKAPDEAAARQILGALSGTTHSVITGVVVLCAARNIDLSRVVQSMVTMRSLTDAEIDAYIAGGQWRGKAGAYGIQDRDPFVSRMAGSLSNIVGLPMEATAELLAQAGVTAERRDEGT